MQSGEFYAVTRHDEDGFNFASKPHYCTFSWIASGYPCSDLFPTEEHAQILADEFNKKFPKGGFVVKRFAYTEIPIS